jgi:glycosyltransferase involved in cell wall biosynthesis
MTPTPLPVSVVIPVYNRADMLRRALTSVAAQVPNPPGEVIVVDDASTDNTPAVARSFDAHVIRHQTNRGPAAARNTAIAAAHHPWIALLDSDDEWLPHHLATLWELRKDHVLVADSCVAYADPERTLRFQGPLSQKPAIIRSPNVLLYPENFIPASGAMVARSIAEDIEGYDESLRQVADLEFFVRVLERGSGIASSRIGTIYHLHAGQMIREVDELHAEHLRVVRSFEGRSWWSPSVVELARGALSWDRARLMLAQNRRREALREFAFVASHPLRIAGMTGLWRRRLRIRQDSKRLLGELELPHRSLANIDDAF